MGNFLPNDLVQRLNEREGFDSEAFAAVHEQGDKVTSIRLNPFKQKEVPFSGADAVPWCDLGYYLPGRPSFTLDPLYHAGCYYVQEASSMFIAHVLETVGLKDAGARALDLCAAPGGKSTLLNSYLGEGSLLVSNEVIKSRANILLDNLGRWGSANVVVTNNDPSSFKRLPGYFDLLVVDAPCSGSGMFRKDKQAIDEWSLANVKLCSDRQKRILAESLETLITDGYLVYSTCSYSEEENEDILDWLLSQYDFESIEIPIEAAWGIERTTSRIHGAVGYRFYPHQLRGEGFFIAVLRKRTDQPTFSRKRLRPEKATVPVKELENWIEEHTSFSYFMHADELYMFPKTYLDDLQWLKQVLYIKRAGTNIGKWTGREFLPSHELACSIHVHQHIAAQDVNLEVALQYLRKEALDPQDFQGRGWCLVRYKAVNIGWVKVLPNRINNYYPKEVRIMNL
ncbi:16S rRNA C967 or C1407 C5-methylase (RsmB/RsmF family) [Sphingobacterium allocomposti]|uniref:16S rRNA C967 or C1407 C5-methylase (RsmB/RsmF family) n=1 Tax=Sphingobacterium allocomposti TaxID=415956 RepID=A0A5S5D5A8_9SPHI|nr:RNA methyltransferase [Sphingobacterium composti Yoo et al. 2007 non Ten et al. 2007]TYP91227.1 16S rRNA C967 or C1407 C5-methylase (RsmB/RsmF family) [Sphingobacterium composti Yoo et al. 2007 non Ten et al. 2007]